MGSRAVAAEIIDVLVVDDHQVFADAITLAIEAQPGLRCMATVHSAEAALEILARSCPWVVLLDLALPGMNGVDAIRPMKERCPGLRVIVLTANSAPHLVLAAAQAGAAAFLPKERPFAEVLRHLRGDDIAIDSRTMDQLLRAAAQSGARQRSRETGSALTDREEEVLCLLAAATPVKTIAVKLGISVNTCRGHVRSLLGKLGAHSQLEAVVLAAQAGLLARPAPSR